MKDHLNTSLSQLQLVLDDNHDVLLAGTDVWDRNQDVFKTQNQHLNFPAQKSKQIWEHM